VAGTESGAIDPATTAGDRKLSKAANGLGSRMVTLCKYNEMQWNYAASLGGLPKEHRRKSVVQWRIGELGVG
jgi:hypothetical protein